MFNKSGYVFSSLLGTDRLDEKLDYKTKEPQTIEGRTIYKTPLQAIGTSNTGEPYVDNSITVTTTDGNIQLKPGIHYVPKGWIVITTWFNRSANNVGHSLICQSLVPATQEG